MKNKEVIGNGSNLFHQQVITNLYKSNDIQIDTSHNLNSFKNQF